jgi:Sulfatase-modifying factor enzyme 1
MKSHNSVDRELGRILDKMITNFLNQRYQTVEGILADLDHQQNNENDSSVKQYLAIQQKSIEVLLVKDLKDQDISLEMNYVDAGILNVNKKGNDSIFHNYFGFNLENYSQVLLKAFYISKYPITQRQYQSIMGKKLFEFKVNSLYDFPAHVDWYDAMKFCKKLSIHTNNQHTLPSVSQWEYACFGEMIPSDLNSFILNRISYNQGNEWCLDESFRHQDRPSDGSATIDISDSHNHISIGLSRNGIRTKLLYNCDIPRKASFRVVCYDYS